jgi:hypothetical protein
MGDTGYIVGKLDADCENAAGLDASTKHHRGYDRGSVSRLHEISKNRSGA